jgi:hypothetical protein
MLLADHNVSEFVHVTALHVRHLPVLVEVKRFRHSNKPSMYRPRSCESEDFVKCSEGYHIMKINADIQVQALWRAVID